MDEENWNTYIFSGPANNNIDKEVEELVMIHYFITSTLVLLLLQNYGIDAWELQVHSLSLIMNSS